MKIAHLEWSIALCNVPPWGPTKWTALNQFMHRCGKPEFEKGYKFLFFKNMSSTATKVEHHETEQVGIFFGAASRII